MKLPIRSTSYLLKIDSLLCSQDGIRVQREDYIASLHWRRELCAACYSVVPFWICWDVCNHVWLSWVMNRCPPHTTLALSWGYLAFGEACWETLLMTINLAITLMVGFPYSVTSFFWYQASSDPPIFSSLLHPQPGHVRIYYFLYSSLGSGTLFLVLSLLYHVMVPFLFNSGYFLLICGTMWTPPRGVYQTLLWPIVWGKHLKPKHILSQISPSSFKHQNGFQFPEWQIFPLY